MHKQSAVEALEIIENVNYENLNGSGVGTPIGNNHTLHYNRTSYTSWLQLFGVWGNYLEAFHFVLKN